MPKKELDGGAVMVSHKIVKVLEQRLAVIRRCDVTAKDPRGEKAASADHSTFTMALELLTRRVVSAASGMYKKALSKELNKMGE